MVEKNHFDKLFVSYLSNELSAEEDADVIKSINSDPALHEHFEELKNVFRLLEVKKDIDNINIEEELKHFVSIYKAKQNEPPKIIEAVYDIAGAEDKKKFNKYNFVRALAVAASLLLVLGIGWRMLNSKEVKNSAIEYKSRSVKDSRELITRNEVNVSGVTRRFLLRDGTEVTLWDESIVSFSDPFSADKRDIDLKGKAGFKVAKDKTRPFKVLSGDITTTALGTEFIVTNFATEQTITVHLIEGKVMVNSAENAKIKLKKPVYLLSGQELLYNKQTADVIVRKIRKSTSSGELATEQNLITEDPSVPENSKGSWYMFNNQSLPQIFDQLEQMFGEEILYNKKDMAKLYFIGKFDRTDSLEFILKNITTINNLTLKKKNNKFLIHK